MKSPTVILSEAWRVYTANIPLYISIYAVPWVLLVILVLIFGSTELKINEASINDVPLFLGVTIVAIVVQILSAIAMIKAVSSPAETTLMSAYGFAKTHFFGYLIVSFMTGLIVTLGFVLLLVPGIIFMVWFAFATFILIFEGKKGTGALKASREYVRGRWWAVLGRIGFLIVIVLLISIVLSIVAAIVAPNNETVQEIVNQFSGFLVVPLSVAYMYILYTDVKNTPVAAVAVEFTPETSTQSSDSSGVEGETA